MWQNIIVIIIVLIAAYYALRHLWANIAGRRACDVDQCGDCPFAEGCNDSERKPRGGDGGCGCGCCH